MIGVVIPVHDEAKVLASCLRSVARAAADGRLAGEKVRVFVALDACSDASEAIARSHGAIGMRCNEHNVGSARACAAACAIDAGARWLASTDADSLVPQDWLSAQLAHAADGVCGTVRVADWSTRNPRVHALYDRHYVPRNGHRHVHGANLGVSTPSYRRVGGFTACACGEDVSLVHRLQGVRARIAWAANPCVITSARHSDRCTGGFSSYLDQLGLMLGTPERESHTCGL